MRLWTTLADEVQHQECTCNTKYVNPVTQEPRHHFDCPAYTPSEERPATPLQLAKYLLLIVIFWVLTFAIIIKVL